MDQQQDRRQAIGLPVAAPRARQAAAYYYLHPLLAGPLRHWPALLDRLAGWGFSHVAVAPIFQARSVLLAEDFDAPHPALQWDGDAATALRFLDAACRERGLHWMLDVVLDRVAEDGAIARAHPELFAAMPGEVADPRRGEPFAAARGDASEALAGWWSDRLRSWRAAGADGFRLLGLERVDAGLVRRVIAATRESAAGGTFLGWTDRLPGEALAAFEGCGLDRTNLTLTGWDFASDWLSDRLDRLWRLAPAVISVEAPFERRLAAAVADPVQVPAALRRAVATAAALGEGWLMPMGFESGTSIAMDPRRSVPDDLEARVVIAPELQAANRQAGGGRVRPVAAPGLSAPAFLRGAGPHRTLVLINPDLSWPRTVQPAQAAAQQGGEPPEPTTLQPGEVRALALKPAPPICRGREPRPAGAARAAAGGRIALERIEPAVEAGRFAAKRTQGEWVTVEADVICDGHDQLAAVVQWRPQDQPEWREARMAPLGNDRWRGRFLLTRVGRYLFRVQAWRDAFATFRDELAKKTAAGVDVRLELIEGRRLVERAAERETALADFLVALDGAEPASQVTTLLSPELAAAMAVADDRPFDTVGAEFPIDADRVAARFAAWYEVFPRSLSDDEGRHGTFGDVIRHLPRIRDMGFDVLYFPPIHPIGRVNRKGRNNALRAGPDDPGSPYAIGSAEGGHDAIHPQLGTFNDFRRLREAAAGHGLELALDFAIQCAPDHPWLRQHPNWFAWRPDGSMRFAENPPKKYEDIVNVDFYADGAVPELWVALCEVVLLWARQGVRTFRVDNPHTKPLPFWEWLIAEVRASYPDTVFLAEAFTRPKVMNRLGKVGFTQSYTYFTWRNTKRELQEYLTELSSSEQRDFFRPNFFVNTPDINPPLLQTSGRPGFLIRAALAATLSGLWGVYNGFELCEGTPIPGREEYMDSEKYQLRAWDWERPGNIVAEISRLNQLRRRNPALQSHLGVTFLPADNDAIMFYEKATPERDNVVLMAVSLDPHAAQSAAVELPLWRWGLPDQAAVDCEDLLHGHRFTLHGKHQRIGLAPDAPYLIWRAHAA